MKATALGWANDVKDPDTTIPGTHDRIAATAMAASRPWTRDPEDVDSPDRVAAATGEPHGQIECTVGRRVPSSLR